MEATAEIKAITEALTRANSNYSELKEAVDTMKSRADNPETREMIAKIEARIDAMETKAARPTGGDRPEFKSVAEIIRDSEQFKKFSERGWHQGGFNMNVDRKAWEMERKTTIDSAAVGAATPGVLNYDRVPGIVKPGIRRLRVRDLLPQFTTTMTGVDFVKENVFTNAASPQTESSAKAESALTFTVDSARVTTIAHWIPASRQVLDDFAQLQAYVSARLLDGLMDKEDSELLLGDGLGAHLTGIYTDATAYDTGRNVAGDTRIDKLSHALSQLEESEYSATGIIIHPKDWRTITLIKEEPGATANTGAYLLGSPALDFAERLWGLPVVRTTAMTVGTFLVGAFDRATAIWDRMEMKIDISTEHSDYFTKNLVAIRAEERLALTTYLPGAMIKGSF